MEQKKLNIAIIGYGKMGKTIEKILSERGHEVVLKITSKNKDSMTTENLQKADVAIEFTNPQSAINNFYRCFEANIPVVSGSTGWLNQLEKVTAKVNHHNGSLFYAPNFSVGVNIFYHINKLMAKLMNKQSKYDVDMEEIHHTEKLDSPSGTAIKTAETILNELERKNNWVENRENKPNELLINAKREPNVPGTHTVRYFNEIDEISITHQAYSRKGFALGSVLAAEFIVDKKGIFEMKDMLNFENI